MVSMYYSFHSTRALGSEINAANINILWKTIMSVYLVNLLYLFTSFPVRQRAGAQGEIQIGQWCNSIPVWSINSNNGDCISWLTLIIVIQAVGY